MCVVCGMKQECEHFQVLIGGLIGELTLEQKVELKSLQCADGKV